MKKGFTLIELLAVIVILAIISAIAIPIVIKVIDNVKISSLKISMSNIEKAIELYINRNQIKENKTFTCSDGVCIDESNNKLEVSGIVPEEGTINITPSGTITYNKLIIDGYLCDKYNDEFVCNKKSKNFEETKEESIIIQNTSTSLSNYKIYGNSVQNGKPSQDTPIEVESVGEKTRNLIPYPYDNKTKTLNGITFTDNGDGSISIKGTAVNSEAWFILVKTIELGETNINAIGVEVASNGQYTVSKRVFYNANLKRLSINIPVGETVNETIYPMLVEGVYTKETMSDYEPYNKYKIPVKVSGKNLYASGTTSKGWTLLSGDTYYHYDIYVGANQTVTVSWDGDLTKGQGFYLNVGYTLAQRGNSGGKQKWLYHSTSTSLRNKVVTVTTDDNGYVYLNVNTWGKFDKLINLQVEYGDIATEYQPYYEPITTNIYLDSPLRKIGNYVDYIDYKNQKLIKNIGVLNLNAEDNFELINDYFILNLESYPKKDKELSISNYLEYGTNFTFDNNKLKLRLEGINTIEELKTWLRDNNVEIYYPLSKSVVRDIELPEINLNKNYSNIKVDTNIKPSNMLIEFD